MQDLVRSLQEFLLGHVANVILGSSNRGTMSAVFALFLICWHILSYQHLVYTLRVFSSMKHIKTTQRSWLNTDTLDHLIRVSMEGPTLQEWDPILTLQIWES